jgi:hypothetical protein
VTCLKDRLFLLFGKKGCFAIADFWQKIGQMSKADALVQLEKFFYKGLEHNGVKLPAVIFEYGSESPSGAKLSPSLAKSLANGLDLTADALVQLEKFFYKGLEHNGVKLPAVINFADQNG